MNFVQLCEELIIEAEMLNALASAPELLKLVQDMKEFPHTFAKKISNNKPLLDDKGEPVLDDKGNPITVRMKARKEQLKWREKLEQAMLEAFKRMGSSISKQTRTTIPWKELDDHIKKLAVQEPNLAKSLRLLHSTFLGEENCNELGIPVQP
jgi:hypothetical protein